jgi:Tfp pilus assembly protein PilN
VLRSNLSTRPFYNERVVHLLITLGAVAVLAITLFNVAKVADFTRRNRQLSARMAVDRAEAQRLTTEAARIRRSIDAQELTLVSAAARQANELIDQRTFSWTSFFNHLEATLPEDVMLVSVRPAVERGATRVSMVVLGRSAEAIDEFIEELEGTGAFEGVLARETDRTDEGLNRAVLEAVYTPGPADPAAPAAGVER